MSISPPAEVLPLERAVFAGSSAGLQSGRLGLAALLAASGAPTQVLGTAAADLDAVLAQFSSTRPAATPPQRIAVQASGGRPIDGPDRDDPLVLTTVLRTRTIGGVRLVADDWTPVPVGSGEVIARIGELPVVVEHVVGAITVVVIGSASLLDDRWIAADDNARFATWAVTGSDDDELAQIVRGVVPDDGAAAEHRRVPQVRAEWAAPCTVPVTSPGSADFLRAAAHGGRHLSPAVYDALVDFADDHTGAGALLIRGVDVGTPPATPPSPTSPSDKSNVSELSLLTVARILGHPVGYEPEHGGDIVQNILPTASDASSQTSTSSKVQLAFHTETAFHRHRPRYLLLLCLRGDPAASTTLCCIDDVLAALPLGVRATLSERRFRTRADESFGGGVNAPLGAPMAVLTGSYEHPTLTFDAELTGGLDAEATEALAVLSAVIERQHTSVVLEAGDLLVVDNARAVHGRSPFPARFDGTDRWLQRTFVVADLALSGGERSGRIVATRFAS